MVYIAYIGSSECQGGQKWPRSTTSTAMQSTSCGEVRRRVRPVCWHGLVGMGAIGMRRKKVTKLESAIKEQGYSAAEIAKLTDVSVSAVKRSMALGIEHSTVYNALKISLVLGVTIEDLLGDAE